MYLGFDLKIISSLANCPENYLTIGQTEFITQKRELRRDIDNYLGSNGVLDGSKITQDWFPSVQADVFLSHSHADEKIALALAGYLKLSFGLTTFIDSSVWGYSNDLLRKIDDLYCRQEGGNYDYDARNFSTTHVHLMLSVALNKMIDKTECLMFLNSPNSINVEQTITKKTFSPWLYSEIAFSKIVQRRMPVREVKLKKLEESIKRDLQIAYEVNLNHLISLDADDIDTWTDSYLYGDRKTHPLDILYYLKFSKL